MAHGNPFVETEIRSRKAIYYLVQRSELNGITRNSIIGDIGFLAMSLSLSVYVSQPKHSRNGWLVVLAAIFGIIAVIFYISKVVAIRRVLTGEVVGGAHATATNTPLHIVRAIYGTDAAHSFDVTDTVRGLVVNGRLDINANNGNFGEPHLNVVKNLTIDYEANGIATTRQYQEGDRVILP